MNKNNNSSSKMVDEKISCDSSIKGKLLRTNDEINSSNVKIKNGLKKFFLVPPPIPNIIDFSKLFYHHMIWKKYDRHYFFLSRYNYLFSVISYVSPNLTQKSETL